MLDQRRKRWAGVVQMLYKCFVFAGILRLDTAFLDFHGSMIVLDGIVWVCFVRRWITLGVKYGVRFFWLRRAGSPDGSLISCGPEPFELRGKSHP